MAQIRACLAVSGSCELTNYHLPQQWNWGQEDNITMVYSFVDQTQQT